MGCAGARKWKGGRYGSGQLVLLDLLLVVAAFRLSLASR
jgi:hypothetical protein